MNVRLWVGVAAMLISGRASAEGEGTPTMSASDARFLAALTVEVSAGAGDVFDTSRAPSPAQGMPGVRHDSEFAPTISLGLGGFVSDSVALLARGTCTGPANLCFLGPAAQYWLPGRHVWVSAGAGLGADESCTGRHTTVGTDSFYCRPNSDAFDARVGVLLNGKTRGTAGVSLALEFIQVGTFTSDGTGDALSFQLGYQWH